jgi:hypothetical protein
MTVATGFPMFKAGDRNDHRHRPGTRANADHDPPVRNGWHEPRRHDDLHHQREYKHRAGKGPIGKDKIAKSMHRLRS